MKRRDFMKTAGLAGAGFLLLPGISRKGLKAAALMPGLSDPAMQPKFVNYAPNALDPGFKYAGSTIGVGPTKQMTGLVAPDGVTPLLTNLWGYGEGGVYTWPGKTIEVTRSATPFQVTWKNQLIGRSGRPLKHLLPVDESLH